MEQIKNLMRIAGQLAWRPGSKQWNKEMLQTTEQNNCQQSISNRFSNFRNENTKQIKQPQRGKSKNWSELRAKLQGVPASPGGIENSRLEK